MKEIFRVVSVKEITKKVITFYLETKYKYKKGKRETRKIFSVFF